MIDALKNFGRSIGRAFKSTGAGGVTLSSGLGSPVLLPRTYRVLATKGYQNTYVAAAIGKVSGGVSSIPWLLFRGDGDDRVEIEKHPLIDIIQRPNPGQGRKKFIETLFGHLLIDGNAFILRVGAGADGLGTPREMWVLRPDLVEPVYRVDNDANSDIVAWDYMRNTSGSKQYPVEQVLHLKTFNPLSDKFGLSPLVVSAASVVANQEAKKWNVSLLQNSARPPGVLSTKGMLIEEQYTKLREQVNERYSGAVNAGRPMLLEGGLSWSQTALSPSDMDWLNGQKLSAREIAITFGVPPEILGDSENKTYSNYGEARRSLYQETVIPACEWLRDELNEWIVPLFGDGLEYEVDTEQVPAMQEDRALLFQRAQTSDFLTVNEKRELVGYDSIDGGDVIMQSLTLVPMGVSRDEPEGIEAEKFNKAFGVSSEDQKSVYWKAVDARRQRYSARVAQIVGAQLRKDVAAAKAAVMAASSPEAAIDSVAWAIQSRQDEWYSAMLRVYASVGLDFARSVNERLKASGVKIEGKAESLVNVWMAGITAWAGKNLRNRIVGISETTGARIRASLAEGVANLEGVSQLAGRVDAFALPQIIQNRSEVIARTEVISASNLGSRVAAEATGLKLRHAWLSTRDGRTRGQDEKDQFDHWDMDGQTQEMDEPFREPRSGEQLMFPGDTSLGASAGNVIQCRCVETYEAIGSGAEGGSEE